MCNERLIEDEKRGEGEGEVVQRVEMIPYLYTEDRNASPCLANSIVDVQNSPDSRISLRARDHHRRHLVHRQRVRRHSQEFV